MLRHFQAGRRNQMFVIGKFLPFPREVEGCKISGPRQPADVEGQFSQGIQRVPRRKLPHLMASDRHFESRPVRRLVLTHIRA